MKRILAFVLLGLLIYAGGFVIFYSCRDLLINSTTPVDLKNVSPSRLSDGMTVKGSIYQVIGRAYPVEAYGEIVGGAVFTETHGENFLSKGTKQYFFALPYESSDRFVLLAISDKKDLDTIKQLLTNKPHVYADGAPGLDIYGVVGNMQPAQKSALTQFLIARPEALGIESGTDLYSHMYTMDLLANNRIAPYVIYVKHNRGADIVPLIIGIAMCAAGILLIILLVKRIKDEKESY